MLLRPSDVWHKGGKRAQENLTVVLATDEESVGGIVSPPERCVLRAKEALMLQQNQRSVKYVGE